MKNYLIMHIIKNLHYFGQLYIGSTDNVCNVFCLFSWKTHLKETCWTHVAYRNALKQLYSWSIDFIRMYLTFLQLKKCIECILIKYFKASQRIIHTYIYNYSNVHLLILYVKHWKIKYNSALNQVIRRKWFFIKYIWQMLHMLIHISSLVK